jgi:hypothetical protein
MILLCLAAVAFARAEDKTQKAKVSLKATGSVGVCYHYSSNSEYITFGGPGVRVDYGKWSLAMHFFPSFRYFNGDVNDAHDVYRTKATGSTILGVGPQISYKKIVLLCPCYYLANNNVWIISAGLGYKL